MSSRLAPLHRFTALATLLAVAAAPTIAAAQPVDPYAEPTAPVGPGDGAATGEQDAEVNEVVAAALVARARTLMAAEQWADAQQLLSEAVQRSPDGAAAAEARPLIDEVNLELGITTAVDPVPDDQVGIGDPIDPFADQQLDPEIPPPPPEELGGGGRRFMWHAAGLGAIVGGFFGDAVSADVDPMEIDGDPRDTEDGGAIVGGVLLGGLAGLAVGAGFRNSKWMTRDDVVVVDSFAMFGMVGSLSLAALMQPVEGEAYSVNAILGTTAGAITGLVMAKRRDISSRRMARVDLWAAVGALTPWVLFAAADGDSDDAQVAGFFSMAGLGGGIWLGFRLTRTWDQRVGTDTLSDAPAGIVRRSSAGSWSVGGPSLRPLHNPALGVPLGRGAAVDVVGISW